MAEGTTLGKAYVQIIPSAEGISSATQKTLNNSLSGAGNVAGKGFGAAAMNAAGKTMTKVGTKLTAAVTAPIIGVGTAAVSAATNFETAFAQLTTIADTTSVPIDDLKQKVMDLSNETGLSAASISEAAYSAISAGQDTANALSFVEQATKLAKGGFTDVSTATDVLTTALNAYGLEASEVSHVSDVLIETQNEGKTTVAELAASMGRVIPTAAAANVGMEDLSSQFVALTKNGIATAESTTYINSMLNELSKSGTTASDTFKEAAGMTFPEYIAAGHSTTEAIGLLAEAAEKSGKSVSDVFGSAEAGKAANVLVAHAEDATTALNNMRTMSGQTESAFTTMNETSAVKMEKLKTSLQNIAITLGETILPVITPVIEKVTAGIQTISEKFQALSPETQNMIVKAAMIAAAIGPVLAIGGKLTSGISKITGGLGGLFGKLGSVSSVAGTAGTATTSLGAGLAGAVPGILAFSVGVIAVATAIRIIGPYLTDLGAAISQIVATAAAGISQIIANITPLVSVILNGVATIIATVGSALPPIIDSVSGGIATINDSFSSLISTISDGIATVVTAIGDAISGVLDSVAGIFDSIGEAALNAGEGFNLMADGAAKIVSLNLLDLGASMAALAAGLVTLGASSSSMMQLGDAMTSVNTNAMLMQTTFTAVMLAISASTKASFNQIAQTVKSTMITMANTVRSQLSAIQTAFANTQLSFNQHIALPHFYLSGKFNAETGEVPVAGVQWYAKASKYGALFADPTLLVAGDSSEPEMLLGENTLDQKIEAAVRRAMGDGAGFNQTNNIYSPTALNPSETSRLIRNQTKQMLSRMRGGV